MKTIFLGLIFHSSWLLLLYTDTDIAMLTNRQLGLSCNLRSQTNVVPCACSGITYNEVVLG